MTKSKILTVALIIVLAGLAAAAWFMFGTTAAGIEYANADQYTIGGATVNGTVENLFVDWTSGEVNIQYHSGSGVIVSETANKALSEDDQLRWWLDGSTLRIRYARSGFRITFNLEKKLTVSLPEGTVLKSADIETTSGDLKIPALAADEVRLSSTSGDIFAATSGAKKLTAGSTSGDVEVRQDDDIDTVGLSSTSGNIRLTVTGTAGYVKMESTSGSLYPEIASADRADMNSTSGSVSGSVASFKELKADSTSGSIMLKLPAEPGFTCKAHTTSGSFSSDLPLARDGDTYSCGDGSARCTIGTTSGSIRIDPLD